MPEMREGRRCGTPFQKRPEFFRLQPLSGMRFRDVEQTHRKNLRKMRRAHDFWRQRQTEMLQQRMRIREIAEFALFKRKKRNSHSALEIFVKLW